MSDTLIVQTNQYQLLQIAQQGPIGPQGPAGPQGPQGPSGGGGGGGGGASSMSGLTDVNLSTLVDGSLLVYNSSTSLWVATKNLDKQALDCGQY
jgi:hypothetical protein